MCDSFSEKAKKLLKFFVKHTNDFKVNNSAMCIDVIF